MRSERSDTFRRVQLDSTLGDRFGSVCAADWGCTIFGAFNERQILFADPPTVGLLKLRLDKSRYAASDVLKANCTAPPSEPPVNISWFINGQMVRGCQITAQSAIVDDSWKNFLFHVFHLAVQTYCIAGPPVSLCKIDTLSNTLENSKSTTPVLRNAIPVLGVKPKRGWYVF